MYDDIYSSEENRQKRQYRRKVVAEWKDTAQALKNENHTRLQKDTRREAIAIIEDAARTVSQFEDVIIIWDKIDSIEADRIRKQEQVNMTALRDYKLPEHEVMLPQPIDRVYYRQELKGEFLDTIFDCPHEIHEMTAHKQIHELTAELDEIHKELLYHWAIRFWSPQQIAEFRGQTDRNVRKVYNKMIDGIRFELYYFLYWHAKMKLPVTTTEMAFIVAGFKKYGSLEDEKDE